MRRFANWLFFFLIVLITGCNANEIGNSKDVNPETIYLNYRISGEEESPFIAVKLQYRFGGPRGTTLVLQEPSKVELDGATITVDSSRLGGAYYESIQAVKDFTGLHSIVYTDVNNKQYKEDFNFRPVTLVTKLPPVIYRDDFIVELGGLEPVDYVRVILTDTSFTSEEFERLDTVRDGKLLITKKDLETLVSGPIHLEFYKEWEKPLKVRTAEGGQISINYGLKRDIILKDSL